MDARLSTARARRGRQAGRKSTRVDAFSQALASWPIVKVGKVSMTQTTKQQHSVIVILSALYRIRNIAPRHTTTQYVTRHTHLTAAPLRVGLWGKK